MRPGVLAREPTARPDGRSPDRPIPAARPTPTWERPALLGLLALAAALYLWGLGASGWANGYYSAAVQAGATSWKAFFFGSLDARGFITVDKAPAFLWPMELSARAFGLSSWSVLVPQALEGVATVGVLYATIRRWFGAPAALVAGTVVALTPVAALIFRYNNPDALLLLLLTTGAYALTRALEAGSGRWLTVAFACVGLGFLAKMLQTVLVVPPFALAYLLAAPLPLGRRVRRLATAAGAMVLAAGWWVAAVQLTPAGDRPYIGGSQDNSLWNLVFGYNGFGRLTGQEAGSVGGGGPAGSRWGPTGLTRLFNASFGGQISWLLPAAGVLLVAGLVTTRGRGRTDRTRAALVLWGAWLVVTAGAFSLGQGIIHPYYTVALAPAIGAVVAVGGVALWRRRGRGAWCALAAALVATAAWSSQLLRRTPAWHPALRALVLGGGLAVGAAMLAWPLLARRPSRALLAAALGLALVGPGAYTLATAATPHTGAIPSAGPAVGGPGPAGAPTGGGGPAGGLLDGTAVAPLLRKVLLAPRSSATWLAATVGANDAASYQLATGRPIMAIGGFNGTDPAPTLVAFRRDVAAHRIEYFLLAAGPGAGSGIPGPSASTTADQITAWVAARFPARVIGGVTVYALLSRPRRR